MPDHQIHSEDEIQLPGIKKITKQFFYFLFWVWAFVVLVLKRNKLLLLSGLIVGLLLGYLYYISRPTFYRASMIVQNNELAKRTYAEMIKQLNSVSAAKDKLASEMNTTEQMAAKMLFFDSKSMDGDALISDTSTKLRQPFKVIVGLSDNSQVDSIQAALVRYLNNGPYLKTFREAQTKLYNERLGFIGSELQKLDSLKIEYNHFLASSKISATFYNNAFNPADIYQQSNILFAQREETLRWLYINGNAISVIDGLKSPDSPYSLSLLKAFLILGAAGFLIAFLVAFLKETKKTLA
jgi:hypothetical protein